MTRPRRALHFLQRERDERSEKLKAPGGRAVTGADELRLSSPAFAHGRPIPRKYTCDGADLSPPLRWSGAPTGTKSLAIIAEDPGATAGSWVHWVLYDLAASATTIPQGVPPITRLPSGARQGLNDAGRVGYSGPCPPPGRAHSYYFRVYALDAPTDLPPQANKTEVFRAMRRHVLAVAEVLATYARPELAPDWRYLALALIGAAYLLIGLYTLLKDRQGPAWVFYLWCLASPLTMRWPTGVPDP